MTHIAKIRPLVPVVIDTRTACWRDDAISALLDGEEDIEIHHAATGQVIPVRVDWCRGRRPVWQTIREAMRRAGVKVRYASADRRRRGRA